MGPMCNKVENRWPISVAGFPSVGLTFTRGHFRAASLNHGSDHRELLFTFSRVSGWNAKCKMLFRPTTAARYKNEAKRLRNRWFPQVSHPPPVSVSVSVSVFLCRFLGTLTRTLTASTLHIICFVYLTFSLTFAYFAAVELVNTLKY